MRRVITISLNGNAYQLEDDAHAVLASYLDDAARALASNPDREEILVDLEQAVADKATRFLSPHKTVLSKRELEQIVAEMGPVDGAPAAAPGDPAPAVEARPTPDAPRRLYQISEGALVSGVCNGIAAYLGVDVTLVRVIFVLLVFLTGGVAIFAYLVLMFVVPYAQTSEEHAAARGLPFNARALVERAKQQAAQFANGTPWRRSRAEWRREWRRSRAEWRAHWRQTRDEWRHWRAGMPPPPAGPASAPRAPYIAHVVTGLILAILGIVLAAFVIGWLAVLVSLVATGAVFGWVLPHHPPLWVALVILLLAYPLVAWPIRAIRHGLYHDAATFHPPSLAAWDGVVGIALIAVLLWYGYHHVAALQNFIDYLAQRWNQTLLT
jgi:phage shock protein PspC (stress-responsive transcriptional regulator)